jgi:hypothetical protein
MTLVALKPKLSGEKDNVFVVSLQKSVGNK